MLVRHDFAFLAALALLADLCAALGAAEEARLVESVLEPFAERHVAVGTGMLYVGPVAYAMGTLAQVQGREADAQQRFAEARRRDMRTVRHGST